MTLRPPAIETADLHWSDEGQPKSTLFGDIYYSRESGLEETRHVFLAQNHLATRLLDPGRKHFCVAETGFGTGLNFLCSWACWRKAQADESRAIATLNFVSVERWPLKREDMARALSYWPELASLATQLLEQYPPSVQGCHRLVFEEGRVTLTLFFGDAIEEYGKAIFVADAWFLDGFSPSLNPQMWEEALIQQVAAHSRNGTTVSTFTSAGFVRRSLSAAGFNVRKVKGYGQKRDILCGTFVTTEDQPDNLTQEQIRQYPWIAASHHKSKQKIKKRVAIIGAGLSGLMTAHELKQRGHDITLFERNKYAGEEASGNKQGALYIKLAKQFNPESAYWLYSYNFAGKYYSRLSKAMAQEAEHQFWHPCGLVQLAHDDKEQCRQYEQKSRSDYPEDILQYLDTADVASEVIGIAVNSGGTHLPGSGWISPRKLCQYFASRMATESRYQTPITSLSFCLQSHQWQLFSGTKAIEDTFDIVILANAHAATELTQTAFLPLKKIRGQTTVAPQNSESKRIKTVVCGEGYISPAENGQYCFGATFDQHIESLEISDEDHTRNIDSLGHWLPSSLELLELTPDTLQGHAAFRCMTNDYLPVIGAIPDYAASVTHFSDYRKDANAMIPPLDLAMPGLYANIAHGSKGLASIPLACEIVADTIDNRPLPMPVDLLSMIHPARFIIRDLKRRKI
ncbi:MAG: bifunctional tRNA (5-methylaminomethyl-2-thiouridine)(34)-methyltransferase MnmD/FAD-dependent 5-carboxymethylaminomethyl-2-thiouridine(34) oxidoreductase MnmC [Hahellaceae bacterium]|nr:bifunctional tRNA (5-methylaminomethyl-2-thiouridine)(34)-methyltransferase MnmD/FAD-dependent 5-carboxymethylaminomethyl-2-thiouridine(34) oxidoreductase MnmC [Hahellaceae bacterium]